jgi:hypothetical protein
MTAAPNYRRRRGHANRPARETVIRIAAEEAARQGVSFDLVVGIRLFPEVRRARVAVWARVLQETLCSVNGLAVVWGCDRQCIQKAVPAEIRHALGGAS